MGSGEGDAIKVAISDYNSSLPKFEGGYDTTITYPNGKPLKTDFSVYYPTTTNSTYWTNTIYVDRYQIRCPKASCKATNWLVIDKITPCVKCKAKLKAVLEQPDFEVPVDK